MNQFEKDIKAVLERMPHDVAACHDRIALLESLLRETEHMHLRAEENRDWLNRRNAALGWPPEK